jgi:2-polyprenyl-6-hydroxyphenyl methylase/3-demethylubiquinone-9 3-methyltransferase
MGNHLKICSTVDEALSAIDNLNSSFTKSSYLYYREHRCRYERTLRRIKQTVPKGSRILDVGSHFLHQSMLLKLLGYEVVGIDVSEFSNHDSVKNLAREFEITNCCVNDISKGDFLLNYERQFDCILFCEIQEHITFNPISFWRRAYDLLKDNGIIYITTPNSLSLYKLLAHCKRIVLLQGVGISIPEILFTVTYGHHWKEYSGYEMKTLFQTLSPDFCVELQYYRIKYWEKWGGLKSIIRDLIRRFANIIPVFREEIEVIVTCKRHNIWSIEEPKYF